jgi:hypothetical protein
MHLPTPPYGWKPCPHRPSCASDSGAAAARRRALARGRWVTRHPRDSPGPAPGPRGPGLGQGAGQLPISRRPDLNQGSVVGPWPRQ